MPSKRKKNRRRMRRVQAQRLALEEQNAANHPVKASPGIAVGAPPSATPKKVTKTTAPAPEKILQAAPVAVPIVETPKEKPKPIVIEPVVETIPDVEAPKPEPALVEQCHAEIEIEAHVEVEAEAPAVVIEEAPVTEIPPVEPPTVEAAAEQETKFIIPETEPVVEAIPSVEAPVVARTETETLIVDAVVIKTETELTHDVCEPEPEPKLELEVEAETLAEEETVTEVEAEVATTEEISLPEPATETTEEPVVEDLSIEQVSAEAEPAADSVATETVVESVMENTTEILEPEQVIEEVSSAPPADEEEDEVEVEVLDEEDAAAVPAEPVTAAEDAPVQPVEIPVVSETIPDTPVEEAEAPVSEEKEAAADILVDDFVVTESVSAVEVAISASAAVQQEIETTMETFSTQLESMDVTFAEPEPAALPAEDVIIDAAERSGLEMLSEEVKPEICDMPCQMQIPAEPVQLSSAEISMETALNGHIVPEVSIEG